TRNRLPSNVMAALAGTAIDRVCAHTSELLMGAMAAGGGAHWFDIELYLDGPGLIEYESPFRTRVCLQRLGDVHEHEVIRAGLDLDGLAGLDLEPLGQAAHLHHVTLQQHLMHLDL